jgi:hypothetical protein
MIRNDEDLAFVQKQLALVEHALESLRQKVKSERNFAVYSEGYVDQIAELKGQIDKYQRRAKGKANGVAKKRKASKREKV